MGIETIKSDDGREFVPVPVGKMEPGVELHSDIYLRIDGKFLKYKAKGDLLEAEKLDFFLFKDLRSIYIALPELQAFMNWLNDLRTGLIDEVVEEIGEENRHLAEKREAIKEKVYETFSDVEMDSGVAETLKEQVNEFIEEVKDLDMSKAVLAKLIKHNDTMADHALNTANVALFMGMILGHGNKQVLEDIYFGALFHDYAKTKIPNEVLLNKNGSKYNQMMQDHPKKGASAVKRLENIRGEVIKIIEQHHENFNGNGYPRKLKGDEIFGLAMIVNMANIFDNTVMENQHKSKKDRYRMGIKVLEYDKGKQFDPDMVNRVLTGLKLAYGEFYIPPSDS